MEWHHVWWHSLTSKRVARFVSDSWVSCFIILVTHPKSYIESTNRRDFGGKPSKWRWGRVLSWKIPEFCNVGGARSKNSIFRVLGYPSTVLRTGYRKQFYPKTMVPIKPETLKVCLLLVWRVCDQTFGRYRPLNGAEKWSRDHHENWKFAYTREKFADSKNVILLDLRRKVTKLSRKNRFRTVASPGACPSWIIDARR